jgi:hypothetical protein
MKKTLAENIICCILLSNIRAASNKAAAYLAILPFILNRS